MRSLLPIRCDHCGLALEPQAIVWRYGVPHCPRCGGAQLAPSDRRDPESD